MDGYSQSNRADQCKCSIKMIILHVNRFTCKFAGKEPIKRRVKNVGKVIYGIFAAIVFSLGMCMNFSFVQTVKENGCYCTAIYDIYKKCNC